MYSISWVLGPIFGAVLGVVAQSQADWNALNGTIGGRLRVNTPLALPCFSSYNGIPVATDEESCTAIREDYIESHFRASHASGYYYSQGEICLSDPPDACVLDSSATPARLPVAGASCNQGGIPSYYIEVQDSSDITAALTFSKITGFPLTVKNSGHDFTIRSSQKDSLMLWVYNLKDMVYHDDFVPEGCDSGTGVGRSMTIGTGASTQDALVFAAEHDSTIVVGYSPEVAVSGGWVLGGGHSILSPVYGLGADRVVEFKIVTTDGVYRVANHCQHPDLFWALRGGGGGTFGVVLEATHRVEPSMPIAVADISLPANVSADTAMRWIELTARESLKWGRQGWGGHVAGGWLTHMNPLPEIANLEDGGAAAQASMQEATDFALSIGGTSTIEVLPDFLAVWDKYILTTTGGASIQIPTSRIFPESLFSSEEGIESIMEFLRTAQEMGFDPRATYVPVDTPFVAEHDTARRARLIGGADTSVHPAWYRSLWSVSLGAVLPFNSSYAVRLESLTAVTKITTLMEQLTGDEGGTYPNEGNPFTQEWRKSYWGENYKRLLKIKSKYDPDGLLNCWKCVGFGDIEIQSQRFQCQGQLQQDIDNALS